MNLSSKHCIPCEGGVDPFTPDVVHTYLLDTSGWEADRENKKISRTFKFKNFSEAMSFVNKVADLAESEGHHPDIRISYNKVSVDLTTHAIKGLSENDFIIASKINLIS